MLFCASGREAQREATQAPSSYKQKLKAILLLFSSLCGSGQLLSLSILPQETELKLHPPVNSVRT